MRGKENANDYRYFPDPDLPPIELSDEKIKTKIPELPDARKKKYMEKYGISAYISEKIISDMDMADYFEKVATLAKTPKVVANILVGEVSRLNTAEIFYCPISAVNMAKPSDLISDEVINTSTAKKLITRMWETDFDPVVIVEKEDLKQINDRDFLVKIATKVIENSPKLVSDYKNGKQQAIKALMGQAMSKTTGKANPVVMEEIIKKLII